MTDHKARLVNALVALPDDVQEHVVLMLEAAARRDSASFLRHATAAGFDPADLDVFAVKYGVAIN